MRQRHGKNRKLEGHRHCGERRNQRLNRVENQAMLVAVLPPKAMVMSGCTLPQRPMYDCMVLLWPGSVLMPMACIDTEGLWSNVMQLSVVHAAPRAMLPLGVIFMWVTFTATWDYADVHDPGCLKGLVWVCGPIAIGGHVCSLYCCQKPWGSPWCVLPLMTKSKEATFEVILMHSWERERCGRLL